MPRSNHDNPYRDESPSRAAATPAPRPRQARKQSPKPAAASAAPAARGGRKHAEPVVAHDAAASPPRRRSSRRKRGRGNGGGAPEIHLTSHPTGRSAYLATRIWLLERHGPVCAYCGKRFTAQVMTLDHVAPRRGQTAYDRRDNLVLACPACNAAKRDLPPTAYLLGSRTRAANLVRYGSHLSPMLLEIARALAPEGTLHAEDAEPANGNGRGWAALADLDDGESPYRD